MKSNQKKSTKTILSDRIADVLTVKPRADIEDDQVFGTKPQTLSKGDLGSSESEDETAISDFRKRNVNLLSEISKKYEGQVVSRKQSQEIQSSDNYEESDSDDDSKTLTAKDLSLYDISDDSNDSDVSLKPNKLNEVDKSSVEKKDGVKSLAVYNSDADDSEESTSKKIIIKSSNKNNQEADLDSESEVESEEDNYDIMQFKKQIQESDDDNGESEHDDSDIMHFKKQIEQSDNEDGESGSDNDGEDEEGYDISQMDEPVKEEFEHVKKQNISEEAKKGACVRNQLLLWEGLLEMRIHLQRCINTANQMPLPDTHEDLKQNNEFAEECNATKTNISTVLDKFMLLQNMLLKKYPETKSISVGKKEAEESKSGAKDDSDEEIPSDTDNEEIPSDTEDEAETPAVKEIKTPPKPTAKKRKLEDYEDEISKTHKAFKSFRDTTIQKWNEKTRLAAATNIKNKNAPSNTVLQQISYILSDKEKLVRRTQLKRTEYDIVGYKKENLEDKAGENGVELPKIKDRKDDDEYIAEIFDDSDFYHQLLRELIECKSADISDPVQLSRQWIALQQMRSKMKRKVDTKATKGRKIKYVVHNQLVNYMAPEKCTTWTDESTTELYSSLFGKMFEQNNIGLNTNLENGFKIKN